LTGASVFRGVQAGIGEILCWRDAVLGMSDAMAKSPNPWLAARSSRTSTTAGLRMFMSVGYGKIKEILHASSAGDDLSELACQ